jgi:hypothetical protein
VLNIICFGITGITKYDQSPTMHKVVLAGKDFEQKSMFPITIQIVKITRSYFRNAQ